MNKNFPEVKGNLGFGMMRLPMKSVENPENDAPKKVVDNEETCKMVDAFIDAGFNYFDTAHGYIDEMSEVAVRECLTARHSRDEYVLANKLSNDYFNSPEDIEEIFGKQLEICGVDYFDFYLMHAQDARNYDKYCEMGAYDFAVRMKNEGKIKHVGISFHDRANILDRILEEHPEVEFVQIQLNYVDFESEAIQSRRCLEVCNKYNKPAVVMEPVRGGALADLPEAADAEIKKLGDASAASYALRFAASCEGVYMVLSGMSNPEQMKDNLDTMKDFKPINDEESKVLDKVIEIFKGSDYIPCTACHYCTAGCPMNINIPELFSSMNSKMMFHSWNSDLYYSQSITGRGKAGDCIKCGLCEQSCPQHLEIRALLEKVADEFEKKDESKEE